MDFSGKWKNTRGSVLEIKQDKEGNITGTFKTAVASTKKCIGYPAPIKGFVNGNAIALTIDMKGCGSPTVLSQIGLLDEETNQIQTTSLILKRGNDEWNSKNLCNDTYTKMQ